MSLMLVGLAEVDVESKEKTRTITMYIINTTRENRNLFLTLSSTRSIMR